jgi:hypothetical protein
LTGFMVTVGLVVLLVVGVVGAAGALIDRNTD